MREDHAALRAAGGILRARTHGGSAQSLGIGCEGGASDLIDFSVNVNPAGPSPRAVAAACKSLSRIDATPIGKASPSFAPSARPGHSRRYYRLRRGRVRHHLAARCGGAPETHRRVRATFSEYAEAASYYGACVQEFPLSEADDFDVPASFARAIEGPGDVAYLCNPNNPTGRLVDPSVIDAAACRCEQVGALLVVDECFLGFAPDARERSVAARAACSHHVAVLSAFTKLYGMAGLRLGYLISGNAQLLEGIRRAGQAWPVSSVAEAAGIAALEDVEYVSRTRDVLAGERAWLSHELSSLGLSVVPSDANFLLVRMPAKDIPERLYKQGVLVRTCDSFSVLSRFWCRVAVRTRKENARLAMRSAARFGRKAHRAKANPTNGAALLAATLWRARMAEARRRRSIPVGRAKPIMIQGTMSNAGKSLLAAGLCRVLSQDGLRVAPFKSQNMALNSGVTADGSRWGAPRSCRPRRAASRPTCA